MSKKKRAKQKPDAWMPVYIGDFLAETAHLSCELKGALMLVRFAMWKGGGKVENHDGQLAAITGLGLKKWKSAKPMLMGFFQVSDNWLFDKQLAEEYQHACEVYEKRVASGKQGGRPPIVVEGDLFDDSERGTERLSVRGAESPPQPQSQPQPPSSPTNIESGEIPEAPTKARALELMATAKELAEAGCPDCTTTSLAHAFDNGVTRDELVSLARSKKGSGKGIAYLTTTVMGQRADAAKATTAAPQQNAGPIDVAAVARAEAIRMHENEITAARRDFDPLGLITETERDSRVAAAKTAIANIVGGAANAA